MEGFYAGARKNANLCAGTVFPQPVTNDVIEVRIPTIEEAKKNAFTVKIDTALFP